MERKPISELDAASTVAATDTVVIVQGNVTKKATAEQLAGGGAALYATAAQGATADTALQPGDIGTSVQAYSAVLDATTASFTTIQETKLGHISVTQAVDLDAIETRVNQLDAAVVLQGVWDASTGSFPVSTTPGQSWIVSTGGTVNGVEFTTNDRIVAIVDGASTTTYAANWHKMDYTDAVLSVAGKTGAVTLFKTDISDFSDADYATSTQGAKADSAVQPGDLATVATTGAYSDLSGKPTLGTMAAEAAADYVPKAGNVTLTGGFQSDPHNLGTITSGTVTPEVDGAGQENFKRLTNNGAFTLAPPSTSLDTTIRIRVINAASAGAINTSGFDNVKDPDGYATTNGKAYWFYIDHDDTYSTLTISEIV